MATPSSTPRPLLTGAVITALSSGSGPALQSIALALSSPRDAGRVLGSLSVLGTLSLLVLTPSVFGVIFIFSVEWFPELVFLAAAAWFSLALVPAMALRISGAREGTVQVAVRQAVL